MKKIIFSLVSLVGVLMLIVVALPAISPPPVVAQPSGGWPDTWESLNGDDNEKSCNTFRNVLNLSYAIDSDYIYLRMETVTAAGWNSTDSHGVARYKWC